MQNSTAVENPDASSSVAAVNTTGMGQLGDATKDKMFDKNYGDSRKRQPEDIVYMKEFDQVKRERLDTVKDTDYVDNDINSQVATHSDAKESLINPPSIDHNTTKSEKTSNLEPSPLTRQTIGNKMSQQQQPSPQAGNLQQSYPPNYPYNPAAYPHMAMPGYPPSGYMPYPAMHGMGFVMPPQPGSYYPTMYNPYLVPHPQQTQMLQENMNSKENSIEEAGDQKSETATDEDKTKSENIGPVEILPKPATADEKDNVNEKEHLPSDVTAASNTQSQQNQNHQNNVYGQLHHNMMFPAQNMMHPAMYMNPAASYMANRPFPVLSPPYGGIPYPPGAYGLPGSMLGTMNPMQLRPGIRLSLACDVEQLSDYQILVRQQLEVFEAGTEDIESNTQGRKKPVVLGQVGLRCRHCSSLPLRARGRGAVYYPAKLQGIYQAAQNMAGSHLCEACQHIPISIRDEIRKLRDRRDNASGGKQYWADGCRALGIYETDNGLKIGPPQQVNQSKNVM